MRLLALLLSFLTTVPVAAPPARLQPPPIQAVEAIVMDGSSGDVLYAKSADEPRPPASMTKLMTLYLAARALDSGRAKLTDRVPVSLAAFKTGGAQIWLEPGEALPLGQLIRAIAIGSANDASLAVGEYLAGSEAAFVARMNQEAAALGMRHTHFKNPHGLDDPAHVTTARDLALLARAVLAKPMLVTALTQKEDRTIRNGKGGKLWLVNHNKLLWRYPGILGLKTGYTNRAGFCVTAAAKRDGMTAVAVVMGEPTSKDRFNDAAALMNWAFESHTSRLVLARHQTLGRVRVRGGTASSVQAVVPRELRVSVPKDDKVPSVLKTTLTKEVKAPVGAGEALGRVQVRTGTKVATSPLVAKNAVAKATLANTFTRLLRGALQLAG